jgi:hypothetical protein
MISGPGAFTGAAAVIPCFPEHVNEIEVRIFQAYWGI